MSGVTSGWSWTLGLILAALLGGVAAAPAAAWTPPMQKKLVVDAQRLMPPALRGILRDNFEHVVRGVLAPDRTIKDFENQYYYPGGGGGRSPARVGDLAVAIKKLLDSHAPMREVAYHFGLIGHYILDTYNPLVTADSDPSESQYAAEFLRFSTRHLQQYRIIFRGFLRDEDLRRGVAARVIVSAHYARKFYEPLGEAFRRPGGGHRRAVDFGVQSIPFGVAALCYSRAVEDTARAWFSIWEHAGGDVRGAPMARVVGTPLRRP